LEDQQQVWSELLRAHREQLREWAENYPPTFGDRHALVSVELARIEGRDGDAMRLYEDVIRGTREYGFVQNEAAVASRPSLICFERNAAIFQGLPQDPV
jgi:hypothetical protein